MTVHHLGLPVRLLALSLLLGGCTDTAVVEVVVPLNVAGTDLREAIEGRDQWQIELSRADIAFGPLYLCSGVQAGALCDTARAEWLGSVVVAANDPNPSRAGKLQGISGVVRSWMYDHGIASLLTQEEPLVLAAASTLGDNSVVVEGTARRDGVTLVFSARVPIEQSDDTETGVPVVRKSASDPFLHDITGDEAGLLIRFDPRNWLTDVDFTSLAEEGSREVTLEPDGQGFRAIRNAVLAGQRPSFTWTKNNNGEEDEQ